MRQRGLDATFSSAKSASPRRSPRNLARATASAAKPKTTSLEVGAREELRGGAVGSAGAGDRRANLAPAGIESLKEELRTYFNANGLKVADQAVGTILSGFFREVDRDGTMPSFRDRARLAADALGALKDRFSLEGRGPVSSDFYQTRAAEELNNYLAYFESLAASSPLDREHGSADDLVSKASQMLRWTPSWTKLLEALQHEITARPIPGVLDIAANGVFGLDVFVPDRCPSQDAVKAAVLERSLEIGCGEILGFWALSPRHLPLRIIEESWIPRLAPNYPGSFSPPASVP